MKHFYTLLLVIISAVGGYSQNGKIVGRVYNSISNEPIPFANVVISGTTTGATTDFDGNYAIDNLKPGLFSIECSFVGFKKKIISEIQVTNSRAVTVDFALEENVETLKAVEIKASPFTKTEEAPLSMRTLGFSEIQRSPGGNRDISTVIQSLPGVASTPSFRNDIIIRGGAPNENRFYLDGIEVPNINHFATQGSSGGPVGLINVNFIREVDFYSGAFPSNRGNALSSVFEFKQKDGNSEKLIKTITVGSSDFGITLDGPLGKKSSFIFSARRSYLQFLFQALKLPFLPVYNDFQLKFKTKFNNKNQLTIVGLGAIDQFDLNTSVNNSVTDAATLERNNYILGNIPYQTQWNYTIGANYQHFAEKSFQTLVVSRNMLNNRSLKYFNNDDTNENNKILDYTSQESENKFRFEHTYRNKGFKINAGAGYEYVRYTNETFNRIPTPFGETTIDFDSKLTFNKYSLFAQASKTIFNGRVLASLGLRTDFNDYSAAMINPLNQLSPRLSLSYSISEKWSLNFNTGRYFQLPAYTVLGYRDNAGTLVNAENDVKYIRVDHIVAGLEHQINTNAKFTFETFYKDYANYPFSLRDSVSLANLGADFGVIGNEPVASISNGRSYGAEFLLQQKIQKGLYGILAVTLVRSEFQDKNNEYIPSAWDNLFIVNMVGGKQFKKDWEVGVRFRLSGGQPYTPYNESQSALTTVWDLRGQGVLDYNRLNSERNGITHGLDIRIDKKYYFKSWTLNVYFDIQNVYGFQTELNPFINVVTDVNGNPLLREDDPSRYQTYTIENRAGNVLPSIGLLIEF